VELDVVQNDATDRGRDREGDENVQDQAHQLSLDRIGPMGGGMQPFSAGWRAAGSVWRGRAGGARARGEPIIGPMSDIVTIELNDGLVVIAEPIDSVASVAVNWALPIGAATDPPAADGQAAMLSELIFRGAGGMSSREHSDALDRLGVRRSSQVRSHHLHLDAVMLGERLSSALPLLTLLVREPELADGAVDPVRNLCLQSLEALDDDPQQLAMIRLRERHLPAPFGRHGYGERETLERVTGDGLRKAWSRRAVPGGSIVAVAGAVDPDALANQLDTLLAGWSGVHREPSVAADARRGLHHLPHDSTQVHIGLAYDAPNEPDEHAILERVATAVLSGSTSGRLFTEVRQKRSLCYSVGASYLAGRDRGLVSLYAGTTPQRAQETLDVSVAEIERLYSGAGVTEDEFRRAVTGLKSHLVMRGESTPARAAALASDRFRIGRARSLDELARAFDAVTREELEAYLAGREPGPYTVVSIGPEPLSAPGGGLTGAAAECGGDADR
jgi:predicted Zn-dependent peptidase